MSRQPKRCDQPAEPCAPPARKTHSKVTMTTLDVAHEIECWLRGVLPAGVGVASRRTDKNTGQEEHLPEEAIVNNAIAERRSDFFAGRASARAALRACGCSTDLAAAPIGRGHLGQPLWPLGFTGSISHDGGVAAAIAHRTTLRPWRAIDIAAPRPAAELLKIGPVLLAPGEDLPTRQDRREDLPTSQDDEGDQVLRLFSAKECAIKLLSPRLERFVDFTELVGGPCPGGLRIHCTSSGHGVDTQCIFVAGLLLTVGTLNETGFEGVEPALRTIRFSSLSGQPLW